MMRNDRIKPKIAHRNMASLQFKVKNRNSPQILKVKVLNNMEGRLVVPRNHHQQQGHHFQKPVQSMQISRHHIEHIEDEEHKRGNLQFSKKYKNGKMHSRTRSNQIAYDECLSNFSNSLENISQQIIEIPFLKSRNLYTSKEEKVQIEVNGKPLQFLRKTSIDRKESKEKRNGSMDVTGKKKNMSELRQSLFNFSNKEGGTKSVLQFLPKNKKVNEAAKVNLADFLLKAMKITNSGSIVYLAIHKKTGGIYAIKSVRKSAIRARLQELIIQIKLGLLFGHPNYAKCYGYFSDRDNFYIIKQYLEQGSILQNKKGLNDHTISLALNQVLFTASCLSDALEMKKWSIDPSKISMTQGIAKLTSVNFDLDNWEEYSEETKKMIEWMFEQDDRRSTIEATLTSNHSKIGLLSSVSKSSTSFLELVNKLFILNPSSVVMLLDHPFLKQSRFKATMLQ